MKGIGKKQEPHLPRIQLLAQHPDLQLQAELSPIRERRKQWEKDLPTVYEILKKGSEAAREVASETLKEVKASMKINYFDNEDMIREFMAAYK